MLILFVFADARQKEKEEFTAQIATLRDQNQRLASEVEELATINEELTRAIGEMGGDGAASAGSSFEIKGLQESIRQLEQRTQRQLEIISTNEMTIDEMGRELVAKSDECDDLQAELVNARAEQRAALERIPVLEAALKKAQTEQSSLKQNRSKDVVLQEEQLTELQQRLGSVVEERDALLTAKGELQTMKAVLERELQAAKKLAKENEDEWEEQSKDLKERLNDAIQARWSLEEVRKWRMALVATLIAPVQALRAAGVDPDEVDVALLSEKMQATSSQQAGALKAMQDNLAKAEKVIKEMRDTYTKTKTDAEATIEERDAMIAEQTSKIAKLTLALKVRPLLVIV